MSEVMCDTHSSFRNLGIDLLHVAAMFMIVWEHVAGSSFKH